MMVPAGKPVPCRLPRLGLRRKGHRSPLRQKTGRCRHCRRGRCQKAARLPRQDSPVWSEAEAEGLNSYSCPTCGAELVCDETTAATTCPYCGNPTVLGGKLSGQAEAGIHPALQAGQKDRHRPADQILQGQALSCPRRSRARTTSRRSRAYMSPSGSTMPRPTRAAGTRARTPRATARAITW